MSASNSRTVWTVWAEYAGTGEGQTVVVWIGYAADALEACRVFGSRFDEFFVRFCKAEEGVALNELTELLITPVVGARLQGANGRANVEFYAKFHLNAA
jgi:hypothetical protein